MNDIAAAAELTPKDFTSDQEVRWCPGCGDFGVRRALELAMINRMEETGKPMENNVIVAGIGCSGNMVHLLEGNQPYGIHGIHGGIHGIHAAHLCDQSKRYP